MRIAKALPRYRLRNLYAAVGLPLVALVPASDDDVRSLGAARLCQLVAESLTIGPELVGNAAEVAHARRITARLAGDCGLRARDVSHALGISRTRCGVVSTVAGSRSLGLGRLPLRGTRPPAHSPIRLGHAGLCGHRVSRGVRPLPGLAPRAAPVALPRCWGEVRSVGVRHRSGGVPENGATSGTGRPRSGAVSLDRYEAGPRVGRPVRSFAGVPRPRSP